MTLSLLYWALRRLLELMVLLARPDATNQVEILVLRQELLVLRRQVGRPRCRPTDRALLAGLARMLPRERWGSLFVRPETIRRWHRALIARRWDLPTAACGPAEHRGGHPRLGGPTGPGKPH